MRCETHYCYCCKLEPITYGNFECGHNVAHANGGSDELSNLRPICRLCNSSMGTKNLEDFKQQQGFPQEDKINSLDGEIITKLMEVLNLIGYGTYKM